MPQSTPTAQSRQKHSRRNSINASKVENERLKAQGIEPELFAEADAAPSKLRRRFGPSTHLSAKEKHERNLARFDTAELVGGGAFAGTKQHPIPADIAKVFADLYEKNF